MVERAQDSMAKKPTRQGRSAPRKSAETIKTKSPQRAESAPDLPPPPFPPVPELPHDEVKDHLLKLELQGIAEPLFFPVLRKEWSRIHGGIQSAERTTYIGFETTDGRSVYVNCAHLLTCHFLWEPSAFGSRVAFEEECEIMRFYLLGRSEPVEIRDLEDDDWGGSLGLELFGSADERFLTLMDEDGEPIAINLDALIYVVYPTEWEEEWSDQDAPEDC